MSHYYKTNKGIFISVEGIDGSGKTTMVSRMSTYLKELGHGVETFREPGGTQVGESIRTIIKTLPVHPRTELLLYYAARLELMYGKVIPALCDGKVVILDRFIHSSIAYQGYLSGLKSEVDHLNALLPMEGDRAILPSLTLYLRIDAQTSIDRCGLDTSRNGKDPHDSLSFQDKATIIQGYDICAAKDPHRFHTVDAEQPIVDVWKDIKAIIDNKFIR